MSAPAPGLVARAAAATYPEVDASVRGHNAVAAVADFYGALLASLRARIEVLVGENHKLSGEVVSLRLELDKAQKRLADLEPRPAP